MKSCRSFQSVSAENVKAAPTVLNRQLTQLRNHWLYSDSVLKQRESFAERERVLDSPDKISSDYTS